MKFLILASILATGQALVLNSLSASDEWNLYKIQHKKSYSSAIEDRFRMKIFLQNKKKVMAHNSNYELGLVSFKMGLNPLSDMLNHEVIQTRNGFNRSLLATNEVEEKGSFYVAPANVKLPDNVDWREQGAVTPVKDQGQCGSCWAFSSTGSLEGQHFRKTGRLVSLSEQNLVDCSSKYGNNGCNGGLMDNAFTYVKKNHGIDTEKSYPYEGVQEARCKYSKRSIGATDSGFVDITSGDEDALKSAVATKGPISVAIDAGQPSFQAYQEGIYSDDNCSSTSLDHGVLVVGYGTTDEGNDYWLVKNSWGPNWGENGYIRMARNSDNMCGIATSASYPLV